MHDSALITNYARLEGGGGSGGGMCKSSLSVRL